MLYVLHVYIFISFILGIPTIKLNKDAAVDDTLVYKHYDAKKVMMTHLANYMYIQGIYSLTCSERYFVNEDINPDVFLIGKEI